MAVYEHVYVAICFWIVGRIHYSRNCNKKPFRSVASLLNWKIYSWFWGGVQISHGNFSARMPHRSGIFFNIFWYFTKCVMKKNHRGCAILQSKYIFFLFVLGISKTQEKIKKWERKSMFRDYPLRKWLGVKQTSCHLENKTL